MNVIIIIIIFTVIIIIIVIIITITIIKSFELNTLRPRQNGYHFAEGR